MNTIKLQLLISITLIALCSISLAEESTEVLEIEQIEVEAPLDPPVIIDPTRTKTTFNLEEIESRQASNVFEILDDVAGVTINGGPRSNGLDINIRGFSDNEDVIYKLDGAVKDFEKYRFGGVFIEPELLKRVDVSRGAATVTSGSGALGGVVEFETKDASDFLEPGQKFGTATKYGHRFNNDEQLASFTFFAAPTSKLDVLFNLTDREANEFELTGTANAANSSALELSGAPPTSILGKVEYYFNDVTTLGFSFTRFRTDGLEPEDTGVNSVLGGFGTVQRESDDKTYTGNFQFNPNSDWIDFKFNAGYTDTVVEETDQGDSQFSSIFTIGDITVFEYDIFSAEATNISLFDLGDTSHTLTIGFDAEYNDRTTTDFDASDDFADAGVAEQPSGLYQQYGIFFSNEMQWGNLTLTPAARWDYNHSRVTFDQNFASTVDVLRFFDQDTSDSFDIFLPSLSAEYKFGASPLTVFYNYWEQYRPPKIDEQFALGGFSRCSGGIDLEPIASTGACIGIFEPEKSVNNDIGLQFEKLQLFGNDRLLAKFTYFETDVRNVLESLNSDPNNPLDQVGEERRDGIEFELSYARRYFSMNVSYSEVNGDEEGFFVGDNPAHAISNDGGTFQDRRSFNLPGDTLTINAKFSIPTIGLDFGWRGQHVDERLGLNTGLDPIGIPEVFDSYIVQDIFATWRPFRNTRLKNSTLRLAIDNVTNERYRLNGGGATGGGAGLGNFSLARDIKLNFTLGF